MQWPASFQKKIDAAFGEAGRHYLEGLSDLISHYCQEWKLTVEGPVPNLSYNYVLFVTCADGTPAVLKISVPNDDSLYEIRTTEVYRGEGCAALLKGVPEDGVQLLERLSPGTMLTEVKDERQSTERFCEVWRRIRQPLPQKPTFRPVGEMGRAAFKTYRLAHPYGGAVPDRHVQLAERCFKWLETNGELELLHGDLHHQNILLDAERGWMTIDPHGYAGDPACDLVPFLYNRLEGKPVEDVLSLRTEVMLEQLPVSREQLLRACIAMTVMSACWYTEEGNLQAIKLQNRIMDWYIRELNQLG